MLRAFDSVNTPFVMGVNNQYDYFIAKTNEYAFSLGHFVGDESSAGKCVQLAEAHTNCPIENAYSLVVSM